MCRTAKTASSRSGQRDTGAAQECGDAVGDGVLEETQLKMEQRKGKDGLRGRDKLGRKGKFFTLFREQCGKADENCHETMQRTNRLEFANPEALHFVLELFETEVFFHAPAQQIRLGDP